MKISKKILSLFLTMSLVFALSSTALAADTDRKVMIEKSDNGYITVTNIDSEIQFGDQLIYYASSTVTVTYVGSDLTSEIVYSLPEAKDEDTGIDYGDIWLPIEPDAGSSHTVTLTSDGIYQITASAQAEYGASFFVVISSGSAPAAPEPAKTATATPTPSAVLVNGTQVSFDAYYINGNNYFRIRDIAKILNGTEKQFEVSWDEIDKVINLISGAAYTSVGGEMAAGDGTTKTANLNTAPIYQDGELVQLTAYNINGTNYIKLRDLGQAFNFGVYWDGNVNIDTSTGYTAE